MRILILPILILSMLSPIADASYEPPTPLFSPPPYIDPGYQAETEFQKTPYSGITWFLSLLGPTPAPKEPSPETIPYSATFEARYYDTIAQLLQSKGIDPASVTLPKQSISLIGNDRCTRHSYEPTLEFLRAAFADERVKSGHVELIRVRHKMSGFCSWTPEQSLYADTLSSVAALRTAHPTAQPYADYLEAIAHFYAGDFAQAIVLFERLAQSPRRQSWWRIWTHVRSDAPWIKETVLYMSARAHLYLAQRNWDGFSNKDRIDAQDLRKAREIYNAYLERYPKGLYASSVRNFERRLLFLSKEYNKLNPLLDKRLADALRNFPPQPDERGAIEEALMEHALYYRGEINTRTTTPLVLASHILRGEFPDIDLFRTREKDFAPYPGLFRLLHAFILYQQKRFADVVAATPAQPRLSNSAAAAGADALRARSLARLGKLDEALTAWRRIQVATRDEQSQLQIAALYHRKGDAAQIFLRAGEVRDIRIAEGFALFALTLSDLESIRHKPSLSAERRRIVEQALMRRLLQQADYARLAKLMDETKQAGIYEPIRADVSRLAINKSDARALLNVAAFMYHGYVHPATGGGEPYLDWAATPLIEEIAAVCREACPEPRKLEAQAVAPIYRFAAAQKLLAVANDPEEARALHYLVRCWRGEEFKNRCQWSHSEPNQSRTFFRRLHRTFPQSEWARKTPYHY